MKTILPFFHFDTDKRSNCGDVLDISLSSRYLPWKGVIVEKGSSPYFHPKNICNPDFYFAIELEHTYSWDAVIEGEKIKLETQPGDIWINPPNTPFTHNIDVPCYFLIVTISEEQMFSHFSRKIDKKLEFLNNYSIQDKVMESLLNLLFIEVVNEGQNGDWYLNHVLSLFSNYFIRHYSDYSTQKLERSLLIGENEMAEIDRVIHERIAEPINIEELAELLHISKFHFLKQFKQFKGITPYQYILEKKINLARQLLKETSKNITEIALDLGFSDSSHFSRTFKKATSESPLSFRKRNLKGM